MRLNPEVVLGHPTWYIVPTSIKDGSADSGGTKQTRITCKKGQHQIDPDLIQECRRSRWMGGVLLANDLSQIELRVAALTSGEPFFCNAYLHGWDMHGRAAALMWSETEILTRYPSLTSVPIDKWRKSNSAFSKREGQVGKRINFSHLFRAGPDKMQASVLGDIGEIIPLAYFEKIVTARQSALPVLWEWQEARIAEARSTGRIVLPVTGHSRNFAGGTNYDINEIVNYPIQTMAAQTLLRIQAHTHRLIRHYRLHRHILPFLNVYDALYMDCATPALATTASSIYNEALNIVVESDYWALLQAHYGRSIPLISESKVAA